MFGSSWANPQQNQQQQQQQPSAFTQPSAFGSTTNNAFGSTSAFGQPHQQNQAQTAQPQVNPMFGNLGAPSSNTTSGGFGATASPYNIGRQPLTQQAGAFGGTNTANTGGAFGTKPAAGFGAFGGGTSAFGGGGTSAFGQPSTTAAHGTTSVFGQPAAPATTSAFGTSSSLFGGNKAFGSTTGATVAGTNPVVTTGTANPVYQPTTDKDQTSTLHYQSIVCMPSYAGYSFEELRVQDYAQGRKTASANTSAFGQPSAFGAAQPAASTGLFGQSAQPQSTGLFGGATNAPAPAPAFGAFGAQTATQPAANTNPLFGSTGAFGQPQPQQQSAFGSTGAFGQTQQPQQPTGIFGGGGAFGSTANKPSAFGTPATTSAFGTATPATTSAFGATQAQPAQGTGLFGATQPAANTSAFGGGAFGTAAKPSIFGTPTTTQTNPSLFGGGGAFGATQPQQTQQPAQQSSLFGGGGLFGGGQQQQQPQQQQQGSTGLFGGAQTTAPSLFGSTNTAGTSLFGNTQQQQQQQQQQQSQQQPQQQTGLFGSIFNKPQQPITGASIFGLGQPQANIAQPQQGGLFGGGNAFNQSASTSLFGGKTGAPLLGSSLSGNQNMGGSLFGASMANAGATGTLTASINQPIAENLPIFTMLPPGPRNLESEVQKKNANLFFDIPTRSPVPRVQVGFTPANSKLRGFGSMSSLAGSQNGFTGGGMLFTSGKPNALSLSRQDGMSASVGPDFLGRSGSPALGTGGRHSVKKVILEKKIDTSELFVKSGSPGGLRAGKVTFSPALSVASREKDATQASMPQPQASPTPTSRTQSQRTATSVPAATSSATAPAEKPKKSTELEDGDYWMKPELEVLKKSGYDELSAFSGLIVGRKGYGEIKFLEPVDLTGLPKLGALLGDVIRFDDKECSVYPDSEEADKPPPGSGLNVKARMSLERCWAVDKATREPITDPTHAAATKHAKRLKNMKGTHFDSFDIKTGTWTFTVDHF